MFKDADLKNIVDDKIKEIITNGREQEKLLKKEIEDLKKQLKNVKEEEEQPIKDAIEVLENKINNELYVLPNKNGNPVPIKKIRYYTSDVTNPLFIKNTVMFQDMNTNSFIMPKMMEIIVWLFMKVLTRKEK